jgi:hypothetical protein
LRIEADEQGNPGLRIVDGPLDEGSGVALTPVRRHPKVSLSEQVVGLLEASLEPLSQVQLRRSLRVRNARLTELLRELELQGVVESSGRMKGWRLVRASAG